MLQTGLLAFPHPGHPAAIRPPGPKEPGLVLFPAYVRALKKGRLAVSSSACVREAQAADERKVRGF